MGCYGQPAWGLHPSIICSIKGEQYLGTGHPFVWLSEDTSAGNRPWHRPWHVLSTSLTLALNSGPRRLPLEPQPPGLWKLDAIVATTAAISEWTVCGLFHEAGKV